MNSAHELAFVKALIAEGTTLVPRQHSIQPFYLGDEKARKALELIYEYADMPGTYGGAPSEAYLQSRGLYFDDEDLPICNNLAASCVAIKQERISQVLLQSAHALIGKAAADPMAAYKLMQSVATDSELARLTSVGSAGNLATGYEAILADYEASIFSGGITGIPTPYPTLTKSIRGWQAGGFYVISAPPKNYKTWIGVDIAASVYKTGKRVLVVSTEMSQRQLNERLVCMLNGINYNKFLDRSLDSNTVELLKQQIPKFKARAGTDVIHYTPGGKGDTAINEVRAKIKEANYDGNLGFVLWDGHYRSALREEWNAVYDLTRATKALCMEQTLGQVPMLATTQEGSRVGETSYNAYNQEADGLFRLSKVKSGVALLNSVHLREGLACSLELHIDFANSTIKETKGILEDAIGTPSTGSAF